MKLTNKYNLPKPLFELLKSSIRKPSTDGFSVTNLLQPPQLLQLTRRHWDNLEVDISTKLWLVLGIAGHAIIQQGNIPNSLTEEKLFTVIDGEKIRARSDLWLDEILYDWKFTSTWVAVFEPEGKPEWHAQLNIYAWLYSLQGFNTKELSIPAILRDWQKKKALQGGNYPPINFHEFNIPLWSTEDTVAYVKERIRLHKEVAALPDKDLPLCTDKERWVKNSVWAVMKEGRKSAVHLHDAQEGAMKELSSCDDKHYVEERKGEATRCINPCDVAPVCSQWLGG